MTDTIRQPVTGLETNIGTEQRRAFHKRRYSSESRFKYIGLGAVLVSVGFLVLLLSTIVTSSIPAFTYTYLQVEADFSGFDNVQVERELSESSAISGDFNGVANRAILDLFPFVSGRSDRRAVRGLISGGTGLDLRSEIIADPSVAGSRQTLKVQVSDFADLYFKGLSGGATTLASDTTAILSGMEGEVILTASEPVFASFLADTKNSVNNQAQRLLVRIGELEAGLESRRATAQTSDSDVVREAARTEAARLEGTLSTTQQLYDALIARRDAVQAAETLSSSMPSMLINVNGGTIRARVVSASRVVGDVIIPPSKAGEIAPDDWSVKQLNEPEANRKFSDKEIAYADYLDAQGLVERQFNWKFFQRGDSREPELAGIWGAVVGSFFTMVITLMLSFPLGVAAAIYLEEFAPKNRLTDLIEVNINNLAAVPSIVFGLLGLAVFLNFFDLPRSAPLVGGIVLALMTLPTIIIASRAALKAVPPSIREAALGVGASRIQAVFHHVLPLAMPGILTGTIIGMAQALGETAPLLMIGMVAFVVDIPGGFTDPSTVLPVQVYLWADAPEPGFQQKTAAAIMVLLGFLIIMNALAVFLRKRFERRW